eukprot:gene9049-biopygen4837
MMDGEHVVLVAVWSQTSLWLASRCCAPTPLLSLYGWVISLVPTSFTQGQHGASRHGTVQHTTYRVPSAYSFPLSGKVFRAQFSSAAVQDDNKK